MALTEEMAADLAELELELAPDGVTAHVFTWNGTDYPCAPGSTTRGKSLSDGGFSLNADLVLFVRVELFSDTRPESKQKLTFNSRSYRIDNVVSPAGEPFLKLICNDPNQGA